MTESYDPYANTLAERINEILKNEFSLERYNVNSGTMKAIVKDAIRTYNSLKKRNSSFVGTDVAARGSLRGGL